MTNQINKASNKPTFDMYGFIQSAFDHFNNELFDNTLPQCLLAFQREKQVMGYFSSNRWKGKNKQETKHEIALNPYYFVTNSPLEIFQTIVHEMCHLWQHEFGKPSRSGYHNKEWADKMEEIGLMPSDTGQPGGKRTGQSMGDYPAPGGLFFKSCKAFEKQGNELPFIDRLNSLQESSAQSRGSTTTLAVGNDETNLELSLFTPFTQQFAIEQEELLDLQAARQQKQKTTFQCPSCEDKAWGKPTLHLICGKCDLVFVAI